MQLGLTWWKGFLATAPVDELVLCERLSDLLLDRISHPHLRRTGGDAVRVHLGALRALDVDPAVVGSRRFAGVSRLPAEQFQGAVERIEARLDMELPAARALRLLCAGALAQAAFLAQQSLPSSAVLQAVLYAQHRARVAADDVLRFVAKDVPLEEALRLAEVLSQRSWWSVQLQDFFVSEVLSGRPLLEVQGCADALGWAQLNGAQLKYALQLLSDPASPVGYDGRKVAMIARGARPLYPRTLTSRR